MDKFEPVSDGGDMDHSEEALGELVVPGCDGRVDLEMTEQALDAIALLVERATMLDFTRRFDRPGMAASMYASVESRLVCRLQDRS